LIFLSDMEDMVTFPPVYLWRLSLFEKSKALTCSGFPTPSAHSPESRPVTSCLFTIQPFFSCSSEEDKYGFEAQCPATVKEDGVQLYF
jgi:hypothetical protein